MLLRSLMVVLAFAFIWQLAGCPTVQHKQAVGTFELRGADYSSTLRINADGTYQQFVEGDSNVYQGEWKIHPARGGQNIWFSGEILRIVCNPDREGETSQVLNESVPVITRSFGQTYIEFCVDGGPSYVRK